MNKLDKDTIKKHLSNIPDQDDLTYTEMLEMFEMIKNGDIFNAIAYTYALGYTRGKNSKKND